MSQSEWIQTTSDGRFEEDVLKSSDLVLVDFWAEWCAPCRQLGVVLDEVAKQWHTKMKFFKLNVDKSTLIPAKHQIRSIPTLIFFKNGTIVDQIVGSQSKEALIARIQKNLS